jgi:P4 family phage/plasmid primase-like protien
MLANFTKKYATKSGNYNYVLLTHPFGKFLIDESIKENINFLNDTIKSMQEQNLDFGIGERHQEEVAELLYYDIDILTKSEIILDNKWIESLIREFNKVLIEHVKSPNLTCVICLKDSKSAKRSDDTFKVGLHMYYPNICFKTDERIYIYEQIISKSIINDLFKQFELVDDNSIRELIDYRVICKNVILKYGCNKPNNKRYEIYKIYDEKLKEIKLNVNFTEYLSIRKNMWNEIKIESSLINELIQEENEEKNNEYTKTDISEVNLDDILKLLSILSKSRTSNYDDWIKVGLCLHNIDDSIKMRELWKTWSEQCVSKSKNTNFKREWSKFQKKENGLGYGSLEHWAKEDNPNEFSKFKCDKLESTINNSLNFDYKLTPSATVIAKVLREKFYLKKYVCSDIKQNRWWEYREHYWVEIPEGYKLWNDIDNSLVKDYERQEIQIQSKILDLTSKKNLEAHTDEERLKIQIELEKINNDLKTLKKTIISLRKTSYKTELLKEAKYIFFNEEFESKLNETKHLMVFKNGVFDFDKCIFRPGKPNDFMSYTTKIDYKEYDSNTPEVQRVLEIFSQIQPNKKLRDFFFNTLAVGLNGDQMEQKFDIWTGTGANGKSLTTDFLSNALGDYFAAPQITLLSRKRDSSSNASPDLMNLKGVRVAVVQEPEHNDTLYTSMLKQLTGGDYICGRQLYQSEIKFKTQLKLFMACNELPKVPSSDGGTWRRMRILEFQSKFVDNPTKENEYKINTRLQREIPELVSAFISVLIENYINLKRNNFRFNEPSEVSKYTKEYRKDSDIIQEYLDDTIESSTNEKDIVKCKDLHSNYLDWVKENYPGTKPIVISDFKRQLITRLGELPPNARGWRNYRMIIEDKYAI